MGIKKLYPNDFQSLRPPHKELSLFWKSYFAKVSIKYSRLFSRHLKSNCDIQFIKRDQIKAKDYFSGLAPCSLIKRFEVKPQGELGFIHLPDDLSSYMIHFLLGGIDKNYSGEYSISKTDTQLLNHVINEMLTAMKDQFTEEKRTIEFSSIKDNDMLLLANSNMSDQMVSILQFSLQINESSFVFTLGLGNRLLEQFVQL